MTNPLIFIPVLFIIHLIIAVDGKKILLLPHLYGSHVYGINTIGEALTERHHEVYTILPKKSRHIRDAKKRNITVLTFEIDATVMLMESDSFEDLLHDAIFERLTAHSELFTSVITACEAHCHHMLHDTNLMEAVKAHDFAMAIVDAFSLNKCLFALPAHLGIPFMAFSGSIRPWTIGAPALPSFVLNRYTPFGEQMSIWQKLTNFLMFFYVVSDYGMFNKNKTLLNKFVANERSWISLMRKAKLFIIPRDHIFEYPTPSMPNVIYTPGVTYKPAEPLASSITAHISNDMGVIVVSFGSSAGAMPQKYIDSFKTAFAQLQDYVVFWKLPSADSVALPSNIVAMKWFPQNDLLGHSATKLFITHCGSNGVHEALYHGVPMVGFPLFAEQGHNALMIENREFGVHLNIHNFTSEQLVQKIRYVINNANITSNVRKISQILKERQSPKAEITYWIEHVLKYGDEHLRSTATDMDLYELFMIDVFAVVCSITLLILTGAVMVFVCIFRFCSKSTTRKSKLN